MSACESVTPPRSGRLYSPCLLAQTQLVTSLRQFVWVPKNVNATSSVEDMGIQYCYSGNTIFALHFGVLKHIRLLLCRAFSHLSLACFGCCLSAIPPKSTCGDYGYTQRIREHTLKTCTHLSNCLQRTLYGSSVGIARRGDWSQSVSRVQVWIGWRKYEIKNRQTRMSLPEIPTHHLCVKHCFFSMKSCLKCVILHGAFNVIVKSFVI